jgi:transcriptional regulator with XRE-family HTH domain
VRQTMQGTSRHKTYAIYDGPDPIDVEVGLSLRRLRRKAGLSQTDLGEALGISFQQVQKYERGTNRISASALVKMARFLGVSVSELLPQEDAAPMSPAITQHMMVRGAEELLESYCLLRESSQRRAVLQLVRVMLDVSRPLGDAEAPTPNATTRAVR